MTPDEEAEWDAAVNAEVESWPQLRPEQISRLSALFDHGPPPQAARARRAPHIPASVRGRK